MALFRPGLPFIRRIGRMLFQRGEELPPARTGEPPVIVPKGLLRSRTNITLLVGMAYAAARLFGWEPPFAEEKVADLVFMVLDAGIAGFFRSIASWPTIGSRNP